MCETVKWLIQVYFLKYIELHELELKTTWLIFNSHASALDLKSEQINKMSRILTDIS